MESDRHVVSRRAKASAARDNDGCNLVDIGGRITPEQPWWHDKATLPPGYPAEVAPRKTSSVLAFHS